MTAATETQGSILAVGGSPRKGGNTDHLLKALRSGAREGGAVCRVVHLRDYALSGCLGCEKCRADGVCRGIVDGMQALYPLILESRGLALFSPTHNYNITAWTKAFIDRLYCHYVFAKQRPGPWSSRLADQGRLAVVGAVCEEPHSQGLGFTLEAQRLPLEALGYRVIDQVSVLGVFAKGGVRDMPEALEAARLAGQRLAEAMADG